MTSPIQSQTEPKPLKWLLYLVSAICAVAGALAAYWLVHEWFGYYGNKSTIFYIGGGVAGYYISEPLWWLYRKRYPKEDQTNGSNGH